MPQTVLQALWKTGSDLYQHKAEDLQNLSAITRELVMFSQTRVIIFSKCLHGLKQHIKIMLVFAFLPTSLKNYYYDTSSAEGICLSIFQAETSFAWVTVQVPTIAQIKCDFFGKVTWLQPNRLNKVAPAQLTKPTQFLIKPQQQFLQKGQVTSIAKRLFFCCISKLWTLVKKKKGSRSRSLWNVSGKLEYGDHHLWLCGNNI